MKNKFFKQLATISATGLACAAILLGNPFSFTAVPDNNGSWQEIAELGSIAHDGTNKPCSGQDVSIENDEDDTTKPPQ